jgi:hypothetical protein
MTPRIATRFAVLLGMLVAAAAQASPVPLVKSSAGGTSTSSFQVVGNGVYPASGSRCFGATSQWPSIPFTNGGQVLTAPSVVGVFWPGAQSPDPYVHALFGDFVTDLFNGPYWTAAMTQYMGSAHGTFQSSVDLPTLLTLQPSNTVRVRTIVGELLAQQAAGVLPQPDAQFNTIYVLHFPPGVTLIDSTYEYVDFAGRLVTHIDIGTSCVQYCAYHDQYINTNPLQLFAFVVMPDLSQNAACLTGCGSGTAIDVYTKVLSHELFESVSDPFGTGWLNTCSLGEEEIADVCPSYVFRVPRRTATPGTPQCPNRWAMSSVFSNAAWNLGNGNGCLVADATQLDCVLGVVPEPGLTATLELSAPSPNPAVQGTQVRYSLPFASFVRLSVTDVTGRRVAVLDRRIEGPGTHSAAWDGRDAGGSRVSAGVYFVTLESAGQMQSRKIVLNR